jgi:hypothetical protein
LLFKYNSLAILKLFLINMYLFLQVEFVCKVEGNPRPQITWFRQTAIIKPSQDFQIFYYDDNKVIIMLGCK